MAKPKTGAARQRELRSEIRSLQTIVREARNAGSFGPAVAGVSRIEVLRATLARLKAQGDVDAEPDPLRRLQLQRQMALADGSHEAATKLARAEAELLAEMSRAAAAKAQAELTELDGDQLLELILEAVAAMDPADAVRVDAAVRARLTAAGQ